MNAIDMLTAYRPLESDSEAEWTQAQHSAIRDRILATATDKADQAGRADRANRRLTAANRRLTTAHRHSRRPIRIGTSIGAIAAITTAAVVVANSGTTPAHNSSVPLAELTGKPLPAIKLVADEVRASPATPPAAIRSYKQHKLMMRQTRSGQAFWYWQDLIKTYTGTELILDYGAPQFLNPAEAALVNQVDGPPIPVGRQTITENVCTTIACMTPAEMEVVNPALIDSLPADSPAKLADALGQRTARGLNACVQFDASCEVYTLLVLLGQNSITAALRATALDLLAQAPGVTVVGDQTVAGHPGLALRIPGAKFGGPDSVVISKQTGEELAWSLHNPPEPKSVPAQDRAFYPPVPVGTATVTVSVVS